jgi:exopolyphosphatase/guanosine-5'-triphosphate,3'-diphosphate pyrophosphatase
VAQAERVSKTAQALLQPTLSDVASEKWPRYMRKLHWAAQLHEAGMRISHSDYHKHGAYILDNTDLPGFTLNELHRLSQLVLGHRGKLRKLESELEDPMFVQQLMALRLAVILCHARREPQFEGMHLSLSSQVPRCFELKLEPQWTQRFPQSSHLLQQEVLSWQKTSWSLQLVTP